MVRASTAIVGIAAPAPPFWLESHSKFRAIVSIAIVGVATVGIAACLASHAVGEGGVEHGEENGARQVDPPSYG